MSRYLIAGLGNPGKAYADTRHSIGFRCVDAVARAHGLSFSRVQHKALVADGLIAEKRVTLVKPQTFMNLSGQSVSGLVNFYKVPLDNLIVVYDDLDLPPGMLRLRKKGGSGGHKGVRDIIERLGTSTFARVRVGIGRPPGKMEPTAFVLQPFKAGDLLLIEDVVDRVVQAIETWLREGIEAAMTRYNGSALLESETEPDDEG
jgi:PTH1 family peptidyl-tRNA hydrolase